MVSDKGDFCPGIGGKDDGAIDPSTDAYIPAPGSYRYDNKESGYDGGYSNPYGNVLSYGRSAYVRFWPFPVSSSELLW